MMEWALRVWDDDDDDDDDGTVGGLSFRHTKGMLRVEDVGVVGE
jgi:hypothetical protein